MALKNNILFTMIDPITSNVAQAKPDYYYCAQPEQLNEDAPNKFSKHIIPSNRSCLPAVPDFFLRRSGQMGLLRWLDGRLAMTVR